MQHLRILKKIPIKLCVFLTFANEEDATQGAPPPPFGLKPLLSRVYE